VLNRERLEDIEEELDDRADAAEFAAPELIKELEGRVAEADRSGLWLPAAGGTLRVKGRRKAAAK